MEAVSDAPPRLPDRPAASLGLDDEPPFATPEERLEFLKHSIAFNEATIRAYDTKSQIGIAAFVVSMNPLWSILSSTCADVASRPIVAVLLCAFIATIMVYCYVLWPIKPLEDLVKNIRTKGLFYLQDPKTASSTFVSKLQELSVEPELTAEVLKLSFIRAHKGRRLKYALWATGAFYTFVFVVFLMVRHCG